MWTNFGTATWCLQHRSTSRWGRPLVDIHLTIISWNLFKWILWARNLYTHQNWRLHWWSDAVVDDWAAFLARVEPDFPRSIKNIEMLRDVDLRNIEYHPSTKELHSGMISELQADGIKFDFVTAKNIVLTNVGKYLSKTCSRWFH